MNRKGFTLIELMIVIAIIAIIAAIAIPNLLDARKAGNEASAIASLRAIHSAQNLYREQDKDGNGTLDYSGSLVTLTDLGLVSIGVSDGGFMYLKQGYTFDVAPAIQTFFKWQAFAWPEELNESGDRNFFVDQTGVLRYTVDLGDTGGGLTWPALGK